KFSSQLCKMIQAEEVTFINIQPTLEIPEELKADFPNIISSPLEKLSEDLMALVEENWSDWEAWDGRLNYLIKEGSPRRELIKEAQLADMDLIIMGIKQQGGSGIVPAQVARKAPCSVLFVPEEPPAILEKILIGCDFSNHAKLALEEAMTLQKAAGQDIELILQHVYQVPMGYYKSGRTEVQFANLMRKHAERRLINFADEHDLDLAGIEQVYTYGRKASPATMMHEVGHQREVDLIIVAARGLSGLSALFLGSVTEKLIKIEDRIPLLIVKRKGYSPSLRSIIDQI
ncbi:MAG: universal stress protein, partial [Bacteroidota bacterium]